MQGLELSTVGNSTLTEGIQDLTVYTSCSQGVSSLFQPAARALASNQLEMQIMYLTPNLPSQKL